MIHYVKGNMFESKADYLVNAVNCCGFMGAGLAVMFKNRCTDNSYITYQDACKNNTLKIGQPRFFFDPKMEKWIVDFPTMNDDRRSWGGSYEAVKRGLDNLEGTIRALPIKSIAIPALGCGIGGLQWEVVKAMIQEILEDCSERCEIYVYEPH